MTDICVTDLAADLLDLCNLLTGIGQQNTQQSKILPDIYGVPSNSTEFYVLTTSVRRRFEELHRIVKNDPALIGIKDNASNAIISISGFFNIENAGRGWSDLVNTHFRLEYLTALQYLSALIRPRYPLKRLDDDERRKVIGEIQGLLDDLRAGVDGIEPYLAKILMETFESLLLALEKFAFFGHATLADCIALARVKLSMVEARVPPNASAFSSVKKAWNVLATVTTLFIMPHDAVDAIGTYRNWTQELTQYVAQSIPPDIKALPAPNPKPKQIEDKTQKRPH